MQQSNKMEQIIIECEKLGFECEFFYKRSHQKAYFVFSHWLDSLIRANVCLAGKIHTHLYKCSRNTNKYHKSHNQFGFLIDISLISICLPINETFDFFLVVVRCCCCCCWSAIFEISITSFDRWEDVQRPIATAEFFVNKYNLCRFDRHMCTSTWPLWMQQQRLLRPLWYWLNCALNENSSIVASTQSIIE